MGNGNSDSGFDDKTLLSKFTPNNIPKPIVNPEYYAELHILKIYSQT
jgi:hypothetical protein